MRKILALSLFLAGCANLAHGDNFDGIKIPEGAAFDKAGTPDRIRWQIRGQGKQITYTMYKDGEECERGMIFIQNGQGSPVCF